MSNAATLHQLRAAAQYQGEGAQRLVNALGSRLYNESISDGLTFAKSNAYTTTATVIKSSAAHFYGIIIEPQTTAASGTGGTGYLQCYNAESATGTSLLAGGVNALLLQMDTFKFVTAFTRAILMDPGTVDNSSLYNSGLSVIVATTGTGSTAVAALPTVTIIYA